MKDVLLCDDNLSIECEITDLELDLVYSDEPKYHYIFKLRNHESYDAFKNAVNELFFRCGNSDDGWRAVNDYLQSYDVEDFVEEDRYIRTDPRDEDEISDYLKEAWDKVWLMRSCYISEKKPVHAAGCKGVDRIFATYDDIPNDGYTDWECGYWNGILGALRWVMGCDRDFLDT